MAKTKKHSAAKTSSGNAAKAAKPLKEELKKKKSSAPADDKKALKTKSKSKKDKKDVEFDDDLLAGEEVGSEEIPDLSEFDENEEVIDETAEENSLAVTGTEARSDDDEIILTDAEGRRLCRVRDCDQAASVELYCRYHYLLLWKRIQVRRKILVDGKLERYVEELTSRYPDKFLEMIKKDLFAEKDFLAAIAELEIDESALENEFEDEAQTYIDEVRGVTDTGLSENEDEF